MDPSPRDYPELVSLVRRSNRGRDVFPKSCSFKDISRWLLSSALQEQDLLLLVEELAWRLVGAGLALTRITVHVGTLHPQLLGFYWIWLDNDGIVDELKVAAEALVAERYKRSPLYDVINQGATFRGRTDDAEHVRRFPLMQDLKEQGVTEYTAFPLVASGTYHNAATLGTSRPNGFTNQELDGCTEVMNLFALHVERHIAWRISRNILDTYLGRLAGDRILDGSITRGSGESIDAIIWMSDLRGFTRLMDTLSGQEVMSVLNAYFDAIAGAVLDHGGEVLKYIGDGLLAVFPINEEKKAREAAASALAATRLALDKISRLNQDPPPPLDGISNWSPIETGIALHRGDVFFGNVGSVSRLDFTVIGRAVNQTSRVESLTKPLGRSILLTEPVSILLEEKLIDLGDHELRGLPESTRVFGINLR